MRLCMRWARHKCMRCMSVFVHCSCGVYVRCTCICDTQHRWALHKYMRCMSVIMHSYLMYFSCICAQCMRYISCIIHEMHKYMRNTLCTNTWEIHEHCAQIHEKYMRCMSLFVRSYFSYICALLPLMYVCTPHLTHEMSTRQIHWSEHCTSTAYPIWGDIFECCLKAKSSKLERLFCHVSVKRDVELLAFSFRKCHRQWDWLYVHKYTYAWDEHCTNTWNEWVYLCSAHKSMYRDLI
jgi:hypothetical protein